MSSLLFLHSHGRQTNGGGGENDSKVLSSGLWKESYKNTIYSNQSLHNY